jgi:hypothetical protein
MDQQRYKGGILTESLAAMLKYPTWINSDVRDLYPAGAPEAPTSRCHVG